jgi:hypothetical protein
MDMEQLSFFRRLLSICRGFARAEGLDKRKKKEVPIPSQRGFSIHQSAFGPEAA